MKRILLAVGVILAIVLSQNVCQAAIERGRTYQIDYTGGVTQVVNATSGGSIFKISIPAASGTTEVAERSEVHDPTGGASTFLVPDMREGIWTIQADPTGVSVSEVAKAAGGTNDLATYDVFAKWSMVDDENVWSELEEFPILSQHALGSSITPYPVSFRPPRGAKYGRFYFRPAGESGSTSFDRMKFWIQVGTIGVDEFQGLDPVTIKGGITQYVINANSGVSSIVVPDGTTSALVSVKGDDICYFIDGTTPEATNGLVLQEGEYIALDSKRQVHDFKAILKSGGSGATIYVTNFRDN